MSDKKQRRLLKRREKHKKTGDGSHVDQVHDVLDSRRCILPEIGNGCRITQGTSKVMPTGTGEKVSTRPPSLPVMSADQEQVKKLSKRSSASTHGFEDMPVFPLSEKSCSTIHQPETLSFRGSSVIKQDCSNKVGSQLKLDTPRPSRLPPIDNVVRSCSRSVGHKPMMAVLRPLTELSTYCKVPDIKKVTEARSHRPVSGGLDRLPFVLPPVSETKEEVNKNIQPPPVVHCAEGRPRVDKAKKKNKLKTNDGNI
uniref:uncharacterized protein LOC124053693 n=1 Tax=Scatophagus argus TaxID=75038 RepID=UPI001ED7F0E5|nr:uncharacterized protein LOC124053693 [Scatophagus argus]